jgi:endonuclease/exonuclease/phosphatase family metal-dependent hydrolase
MNQKGLPMKIDDSIAGLSPSSFTIMTLNLRFGLANDGPNGWKFRKTALADLLSRSFLDFLCLQEVNDFQAEDVSAMLPGYTFIGLRQPAPRFWQNNLIFYHSSWECCFKDHFFLSPTPDIPSRFKESRWPRQCTVGRFRRPGNELYLVNTHFDFDEGVQKKMAGVLLNRLTRMGESTATLITGDFNAIPGSAAHHLLTLEEKGPARAEEVCGDTMPSGFKSVFAAPFPGTHHRYCGQSDGRHIDWILYKGKIDVRVKGMVTRRVQGKFISDHFPLWATFDCNPQGKNGKK